jgi:hypothetical protein
MRIEFERSGGFAGLPLTYRADTEELPQEVTEELLKLVESSGFFDLQLSNVTPTSSGPPDVFWYRLLLSEGNKQNTLSFNDATAPAALRPLLGYLQNLALDQKRKNQ